MVSSGLPPWSITAVYTYGLKDDPTWRRACVARLNLERLKSRPPTMALISPVALSMATSAPSDRKHIRLERRPDLAQSLRGAVELGEVEIAAADHGLDLSGRVIDGDERSFGP